MIIYNRKDWDSDFFGYEVYELTCNNLNEIEFKFHVNRIESLGGKLIYVYTEKEISYVESYGGEFHTKKITYSKNTSSLTNKDKSIYIYNKEDDYHKLLNLALDSGEYSRFRIDYKFINNEFERLYEEWIKRSVSREIADEVFVYSRRNEVVGMVTIAIKDKSASIGLISVSSLHRGENIGTKLLNASVEYASQKKCDHILVPTQAANINACNFYLKNDFSVNKIIYIYHLWL